MNLGKKAVTGKSGEKGREMKIRWCHIGLICMKRGDKWRKDGD
jgi:hypothetical protein